MKIIGETVTLKTALEYMANLKLETLGEIGALTTLGLTLRAVGKEAMSVSSGYTAINKEYGTNIGLLQRWQNVARASNVPVEAVAQTFTRMQQLLASPLIGNPNSSFMRAAGIMGIQGANRMTAEQLNEVLRVAVPNYIRRMTPVQGRENALTNAGSLIEAMGATRSMIQMYTLPERQFRGRENSSPIYSDAEIKNWTQLNEQVLVLKNSFQVLVQKMEAFELPFVLKMGQEGLDIMSGQKKFGIGGAAETGLMSALGIAGLTAAGVGLGASAMVSIPAAVLLELAARAREGKTVTVNQNNKVDIHASGADASHIKKEFDRTHQHHNTRANQLLNSQWAY